MPDHDRPIWLGWKPEFFQFATVPSREFYIALLVAFDRESVLRPSLGIDDVRRALAGCGWRDVPDDDSLHDALQKLVGWTLLEASQDQSARYATPEEFERRNLHWTLSQRGQAAVAGIVRTHEVLRQAASLQPALVDAMADAVRDIAVLAASECPDERRAFTRLRELEAHHEALIDSVRQFGRHLQRLLREDATSDDVFLDVKARTVTYLRDYIDEVELPARRLAEGITGVSGDGWRRLAAASLAGANLAPVDGDDPAPRWVSERERRWAALRAWFVPEEDGTEPLIRSQQRTARDAIVQLLRVLDRRMLARRGTISTANDFRVLARWFAACASEAAAHELFNAAFGAWPARHLHHPEAEPGEASRSQSWLDTPPVVIPPMLRSSGRAGARGLPKPFTSAQVLRDQRQRVQVEAMRRDEALRARLATGRPVRISDAYPALEHASFHAFLALLGQALSAEVSSDGQRRALSADGQIEIVLERPQDTRIATIDTPDGTLTVPDYVLTVMHTRAGATVPGAHDAELVVASV